MQTTVLKKPHKNSHFLTSEFLSGCKNGVLIMLRFRKKLSTLLTTDL